MNKPMVLTICKINDRWTVYSDPSLPSVRHLCRGAWIPQMDFYLHRHFFGNKAVTQKTKRESIQQVKALYQVINIQQRGAEYFKVYVREK